MKKRLLVLSLVFILICNFTVCYSASKVTMYSLDGRTIKISEDYVSTYEACGWYTKPMTMMYSFDGRTTIVPTSFVEENKKVGWYTELPKVTMYALDGRQISVLSTELESYKNVGWYTEPMTMMYALDGRTMIVPASYVEENKKVGWYTELPRVTMYALDGRKINVLSPDVESYKNVGWYTQPMTMMYALDGRTMVVPTSFVEENKKVGWYTIPQNTTAYKKVYAQILRNKLNSVDYLDWDYVGFSLCYIDEDNIPELVYKPGGSSALGAEIYSFDGANAVILNYYNTNFQSLWYEFGSHGITFYRERENLFTSQYWGNGHETIVIYKISDNKAVELCSLDGDYNTEKYFVNDRKVNFYTYMETRKKYGFTGDYCTSTGYYIPSYDNYYKLTSANIKKVLGN